jgi:transcriptional regulator with XRE-family HTH domain
MTTLGELLRKERLRRKERQIDTASRFAISQPSYWRWESDKGQPDDSQFGRIAEYLGITTEEVWELVHAQPATQLSLSAIQEAVLELRRDVDDMRVQLAELREFCEQQAPKQRRKVRQ